MNSIANHKWLYLNAINSPCQGWSHVTSILSWSHEAKREQFHFCARVHSVVAIANMQPACNQTDLTKDSGKAMVWELTSSVSLPWSPIGWWWWWPWQHLQANVVQMYKSKSMLFCFQSCCDHCKPNWLIMIIFLFGTRYEAVRRSYYQAYISVNICYPSCTYVLL